MHQLFKFFKADLAISILICLLDHVHDVIVGDFLAHFGEYFLQALESDALFVFAVEYLEGLQHILLASDGQHHPKLSKQMLLRHQRYKLTLLYRPVTVSIDFTDQFRHLLFR